MYDLGSDPGELENIAADEPERTERLSREMRAWREDRVRSHIDPNRENLERLRSLGYIN